MWLLKANAAQSRERPAQLPSLLPHRCYRIRKRQGAIPVKPTTPLFMKHNTLHQPEGLKPMMKEKEVGKRQRQGLGQGQGGQAARGALLVATESRPPLRASATRSLRPTATASVSAPPSFAPLQTVPPLPRPPRFPGACDAPRPGRKTTAPPEPAPLPVAYLSAVPSGAPHRRGAASCSRR